MGEHSSVEAMNGSEWQGLPVVIEKGNLLSVLEKVPDFEKRGFGINLKQVAGDEAKMLSMGLPRQPGLNPHYDVIVRKPVHQGDPGMPVGIVSRNYSLIQHWEVITRVIQSAVEHGLSPKGLPTTMALTEYGARMWLSVMFPDQYALNLGHGDRMGLRLECYNSVDGSFNFIAMLGWLRFACSSGMLVGVKDLDTRQRQTQTLNIDGIGRVISAGLTAAAADRLAYRKLKQRKVPRHTLTTWVDRTLSRKLGVKAAVRTWHIINSGRDVLLVDPFEKKLPTQKTVQFGQQVPGVILPGDNAFAVTQALSWLAKECRDIQEQFEWKQQIPLLVRSLLA